MSYLNRPATFCSHFLANERNLVLIDVISLIALIAGGAFPSMCIFGTVNLLSAVPAFCLPIVLGLTLSLCIPYASCPMSCHRVRPCHSVLLIWSLPHAVAGCMLFFGLPAGAVPIDPAYILLYILSLASASFLCGYTLRSDLVVLGIVVPPLQGDAVSGDVGIADAVADAGLDAHKVDEDIAILVGKGLSHREAAAAVWSSFGLSSAEIGARLDIKPPTVRTYLQRAHKKLESASIDLESLGICKGSSGGTLAVGNGLDAAIQPSFLQGIIVMLNASSFALVSLVLLTSQFSFSGSYGSSVLLGTYLALIASLKLSCLQMPRRFALICNAAVLGGSALLLAFDPALDLSIPPYITGFLAFVTVCSVHGVWKHQVFPSLLELSRYAAFNRLGLIGASFFLAAVLMMPIAGRNILLMVLTAAFGFSTLSILAHYGHALCHAAGDSRPPSEGRHLSIGARACFGIVLGLFWFEALFPGVLFPFESCQVIAAMLLFVGVAFTGSVTGEFGWAIGAPAYSAILFLTCISIVLQGRMAFGVLASVTFILLFFDVDEGSSGHQGSFNSLLFGANVGFSLGIVIGLFDALTFDSAMLGLIAGRAGAVDALKLFAIGGLSTIAAFQFARESIYRSGVSREEDLTGASAVRSYLAGRGLNSLQVDVIVSILEGKTGRMISVELSYSMGAINSARRDAYRLLGVHSVDDLSQLIRHDVPAARSL